MKFDETNQKYLNKSPLGFPLFNRATKGVSASCANASADESTEERDAVGKIQEKEEVQQQRGSQGWETREAPHVMGIIYAP